MKMIIRSETRVVKRRDSVRSDSTTKNVLQKDRISNHASITQLMVSRKLLSAELLLRRGMSRECPGVPPLTALSRIDPDDSLVPPR
jgi:hypothetical protein